VLARPVPPYVVVFPILPGMRGRVRELARSLREERGREYRHSLRRMGVSKEVWFLQETSAGDRAIVYFESKDPIQSLDLMTRSEDPFDLWFKGETSAITGMDFDHPEPWLPFQAVHVFGFEEKREGLLAAGLSREGS
jgi:hypothetical protein